MRLRLCVVAVALSCASLHASVVLKTFTPSVASPQPLGTVVTFTATATDQPAPSLLAFQFNVSYNGGPYVTVRNYNIGNHSSSGWTSQPFTWTQIQAEGNYMIQVVAKDFHSGSLQSMAIPYTLTTLVTSGSLTVVPTANPLVGLAAIPPCPTGSTVRVIFQRTISPNSTRTPFISCHGTTSSNVYLGGMYANGTYNVSYQINTGGTLAPGGSTATFTAGPLPTTIPFPTPIVVTAATSQAYTTANVLVHAFINLGSSTNFQPGATDLSGNTTWFYNTGQHGALLTRPLAGGYFYTLEQSTAWNTGTTQPVQALREIDLAGNVIQETNVGLMSQQLLKMGATDLQPCANVTIPAPVGAACLTSLSHDAISLPNGYIATIGSMEKIFPPGTQGNTTGLNVDVLGDAIIVLDSHLNVAWYWDAFQHDGGGTQLDINRPATTGDTCAPGGGGCPVMYLIGTTGVASIANDWMHSNSLYYNPANGNLLLSVRAQDWVLKVDYANGAGTSLIDYRLGLDGDIAFNNVYNDPYPWFSHQHDAGLEVQNNVFDCFDNGNTRVAVEGSGNSRGMALSIDLGSMTATPVLSQELPYYAFALGSAQLLANGNYHFQPGIVQPTNYDYSIEYAPTAGTDSGTLVLNLEEESPSYRSFRQTDLYTPPTT